MTGLVTGGGGGGGGGGETWNLHDCLWPPSFFYDVGGGGGGGVGGMHPGDPSGSAPVVLIFYDENYNIIDLLSQRNFLFHFENSIHIVEDHNHGEMIVTIV